MKVGLVLIFIFWDPFDVARFFHVDFFVQHPFENADVNPFESQSTCFTARTQLLPDHRFLPDHRW